MKKEMIKNGSPLQPALIVDEKSIRVKLKDEQPQIDLSHVTHWLIDFKRGCAWIKPIRHSYQSQADAVRTTLEELKAYGLAVYTDGDSVKLPLGCYSCVSEGHEHLLLRTWQSEKKEGFINLSTNHPQKQTHSCIYEGDNMIAEVKEQDEGYEVFCHDDKTSQFLTNLSEVKAFVDKLMGKETIKRMNVFLPIIMLILLISSSVSLNQTTSKAAEIGITVEEGVYQINDKTYINKGDWLGLFTDNDELIYMMPVDERMINKIEIDEDAPFPVLALNDSYYAPVGFFNIKEEPPKPTQEQIRQAEELKKLIIRKLHEIVKGVAPWLIWN